MGIYIPGMEMPNSCAGCELAEHFDGYNENVCPFNAFSYYDCPMGEVPPHGRLIDADKAVKLLRSLGSRDYRRKEGTIQDAIKMLSSDLYTPTVIPKEEP